MPEYRIYTLTDSDKIAALPQNVICENDEEAVRQAKQFLDGHDIEVWQGARLVTRLKRTHQ